MHHCFWGLWDTPLDLFYAMVCFPRPPGGSGQTPKIGLFRLKWPFSGVCPGPPYRPPYPLKVLWYSAPQTYKRMKAIALSEDWVLEIGCQSGPFSALGRRKMVLALLHCFFTITLQFFFMNSTRWCLNKISVNVLDDVLNFFIVRDTLFCVLLVLCWFMSILCNGFFQK